MKQPHFLIVAISPFLAADGAEVSQNGRKNAVMPGNIAARFSDVGFLSLFFSFRGSASQPDRGSQRPGSLLKTKETERSAGGYYVIARRH